MRVPFTFTRPGSGWVMDRSGIYVERGVDEPRYQWTPEGKSEGLLIERQATNLLRAPAGALSTLITGSEVIKGITLNTYTGDGVVTPGANWGNALFSDTNLVVGAIFAKRGTQPRIGVSLTGTTTSGVHSAEFDFDTGSFPFVGSEVEASSEYVGGGVWRIFVKNKSPMANATLRGLQVRYPGNNGAPAALPLGETLIFGWPQLEVGTIATSPIPHVDTPVTRPADSLYADMSLLPGFDPTKGTIVVEWTDIGSLGNPMQIGDSTALTPSNYIRVSRGGGTLLRFLSKSPESSSETTGYLPTLPGQLNRLALRWSLDGLPAIAVNGSIVALSNPLSAPPTGLRYLRLGNEAHDLYRHAQYIPHAVNDAELQSLSSLP